MIRRLTGTVVDIETTSIVLEVQGVGYQVFVTTPHSFTLDEQVTLRTHHAIRDTASDLYGFRHENEQEVFGLLLTIPKVGPKSALQILAQTDLPTLKTAVSTNDASHLSKLSGIGKKTAEKIVLGLKEKAEDLGWHEQLAVDAPDSARASWHTDTIDALVALGYPQSDARAAVAELPTDLTSANEAVRAALKKLGQV